jgi:DNA-binding MurR/RpiR family transcriptional regulator
MAMKQFKWSQMRREHEQGATFAQLAEQYGTSVSTLSRRARLEGWGRRGSARREAEADSLETVTERLLAQAQETLGSEESSLSVKEMKELAGLVRELLALREAVAQHTSQGQSPGVRVVLEGDVEKWSR